MLRPCPSSAAYRCSRICYRHWLAWPIHYIPSVRGDWTDVLGRVAVAILGPALVIVPAMLVFGSPLETSVTVGLIFSGINAALLAAWGLYTFLNARGISGRFGFVAILAGLVGALVVDMPQGMPTWDALFQRGVGFVGGVLAGYIVSIVTLIVGHWLAHGNFDTPNWN